MKVVNFAFWIILFVGAVFAADDEVYVLFRGIHYTNGQVVPPKANIEGVVNQDCEAPYVTTSGISPDSALRKATRLQKLREGEAVTVNDQKFPSMYDCMAQRYVDGYRSFLQAVGDPHSALRAELLNRCNLSPDNIFLISTSLSAYVGLKYAAGICSPPSDNRREPVNNNQLVESILGFFDVFVVPAREINSLYPYFVLEEFTRHHISIPHTCKQKDYTLAEEVIVPFLIPSQYHKGRFTVDVTNFSKPRATAARKWGDVEWIRYHIGNFAKDIEGKVNQWLATNRKKRVYLGPLTHQLEKRSYHLMPSQAVAIRGQIAAEITNLGKEFFANQHFDEFEVSGVVLTFYRAYALQVLSRNYPMRVYFNVAMASESLSFLIPLIDAAAVESIVLVGPDQNGIPGKLRSYHDSDGYGEAWQNYENFHNYKGLLYDEHQAVFDNFWKTPDAIAWGNFLDALRRRKGGLYLSISGQSLSPEKHDELDCALPQCVELEDETHETNIELLDYTLFQMWEGSKLKRALAKDPDLFIKAALQALNPESPEEDLADRMESMHIDE